MNKFYTVASSAFVSRLLFGMEEESFSSFHEALLHAKKIAVERANETAVIEIRALVTMLPTEYKVEVIP